MWLTFMFLLDGAGVVQPVVCRREMRSVDRLVNLLKVTQRPLRVWGCEAGLPHRLIQKLQWEKIQHRGNLMAHSDGKENALVGASCVALRATKADGSAGF